MRKFMIGFIIGAILATVATAYAANLRVVLVDDLGYTIGTTANPIYAEAV